jgi:hypothetical protein
MFLQPSHATKIPCSCFQQVVAHMQLHATIYIIWLYNLCKMAIHFYIYDYLHLYSCTCNYFDDHIIYDTCKDMTIQIWTLDLVGKEVTTQIWTCG